MIRRLRRLLRDLVADLIAYEEIGSYHVSENWSEQRSERLSIARDGSKPAPEHRGDSTSTVARRKHA